LEVKKADCDKIRTLVAELKLLSDEAMEKVNDDQLRILITECKGAHLTVTVMKMLSHSRQNLATVKELMDTVEDLSKFCLRVTDDMRDDVIDFLSGPHCILFTGEAELEFTVGDIDDLIFKCLGSMGCVAAIARLCNSKQTFDSFYEMSDAIKYVEHPTQNARDQLQELLAASSIIERSRPLTHDELDKVLVLGGGLALTSKLLEDVEAARMKMTLDTLPIQLLNFVKVCMLF
jgi:hypothetical protein